jgi:hypothetical protein
MFNFNAASYWAIEHEEGTDMLSPKLRDLGVSGWRGGNQPEAAGNWKLMPNWQRLKGR